YRIANNLNNTLSLLIGYCDTADGTYTHYDRFVGSWRAARYVGKSRGKGRK
ncbi:MAG: hypothetical protein ACI8RD_014257, partial [Bacillariaceae sp.]